jgi:hypothetical protein
MFNPAYPTCVTVDIKAFPSPVNIIVDLLLKGLCTVPDPENIFERFHQQWWVDYAFRARNPIDPVLRILY